MKLGLLKGKEAVLLIVPAALEMFLISFALITFLQARQSDEQGVEYSVAVSKVDAILSCITNSSITLFTIADVELPEVLPEIQGALKQSEADLRQIPEGRIEGGGKSLDSLKQLVADFSEIVETVNGVAKDGAPIDRIILMGNVDGVLKKAVPAVKKLRGQLADKQRSVSLESQGKLGFLIWILIVALVLPAVVAGYALVFSSKLSKRMSHMRDNIVKISLGEPLEKAPDTEDELAELERQIRELSLVMDRARRKERAMLDNSPEIICSLDESLRLSELNPAIYTRLGYEHDDVMGSNIQSLIHPDDREDSYKHLESVKTSNSSISFEARLRHHDGGFVHTQWSTNWSPDDRSILCVVHDISDRKKAEQLKQDVIAMVSHDLRAPLTSIGVVLDMVLEGAAGELNERGGRLVKRAQHSVTALIAMIKDLLDIERAEAGGLNLTVEAVDARELVQRSIDMVKPEADKRRLNIEMSVSEDQNINCDGERLNRVLVNLINNAIKFSKNGKSIYVTCKILKYRTAAPEIEFQVIDEGPGIPQEKLDSIFNKFTQVGTGSEGERMGSGLGLAICKAIVEAHAGKIGVTSAPGEGATFWFRIPQVAEEGKNVQSQSSPPAPHEVM